MSVQYNVLQQCSTADIHLCRAWQAQCCSKRTRTAGGATDSGRVRDADHTVGAASPHLAGDCPRNAPDLRWRATTHTGQPCADAPDSPHRTRPPIGEHAEHMQHVRPTLHNLPSFFLLMRREEDTVNPYVHPSLSSASNRANSVTSSALLSTQ